MCPWFVSEWHTSCNRNERLRVGRENTTAWRSWLSTATVTGGRSPADGPRCRALSILAKLGSRRCRRPARRNSRPTSEPTERPSHCVAVGRQSRMSRARRVSPPPHRPEGSRSVVSVETDKDKKMRRNASNAAHYPGEVGLSQTPSLTPDSPFARPGMGYDSVFGSAQATRCRRKQTDCTVALFFAGGRQAGREEGVLGSQPGRRWGGERSDECHES